MSAIRPETLGAVIGHELRNPLASAVTNLSLLRELVDGDDPRGAMVDQALSDLDRMSRLIDGWLALARTGRTAGARVDVDELLRGAAAAHGGEVVTAPTAAVVDGDPHLLQRALANLLENARRAGARHLRLAAQTLGDELTIHVEDDGCGVSAADLARIFEAGWSGTGGNGLGLFAVASTVRAHGGRIRCVPLRRGTRFSISLPLSARQPALA
ncbi:MAG: HAMP domain-containing sensor histidine kinase [Planctomycetota bacterium]